MQVLWDIWASCYDGVLPQPLDERAFWARVRPSPVLGWRGDHPDDIWVLTIPLPKGVIEMRATTKHVLFSRITHDRKVFNWPVAVFPDAGSAKAHAALINLAHKSGNADLAKALDAKTMTDEAGALIPGIKFSLVEVPYSPTLAESGDDLFGDGKEPTS